MNGGEWIGVDLDGTLAKYDGWKGLTHIGEPVPKMVARVKAWIAEGKDVRVFTARVSRLGKDEYEEIMQAIREWTGKHVGTRLEATCTKDFSMVELWDDRCVQVIKNTGEAVGHPNEN